jgi:type IV pilus assembly protein PilW
MIINKKSTQAFSIVEMMVALLISGVILFTMSFMYLKSKNILTAQASSSQLQDNAQFSFFIISSDVRNSGFKGCLSGYSTQSYTTFYNAANDTTAYGANTNDIQGYSGSSSSTWSPSLPSAVSSFSPSPVAGYDVLTLRGYYKDPIPLTATMASATDSITLASTTGVSVGSYGIVANCTNSALIKVASVSGGKITSDNASGIKYAFSTTAQFYPQQLVTYYVGQNPKQPAGIYSLYRVVNSGTPQEIAAGVNGFTITYGVDDVGNGTVTRYTSINNITNLNSILVARVSILMSTISDRTRVSNPTSMLFNGSSYNTSNDHRLRKAFYIDIALRNRLS